MQINNKTETKLPIMETFYSIQGEGFHHGKAAFFIRIGGCDIGCKWCDEKMSWNPEIHPLLSIDDLQKISKAYPTKDLVVTGGEPMSYNLNNLCNTFKNDGYKLFLETSGTHTLNGTWDWICFSPKKQAKMQPEYYAKADELKIIIENSNDFEFAESQRIKISKNIPMYLQPEWSNRKVATPVIIEYVKKNPIWKLSLQSHKYIHIP